MELPMRFKGKVVLVTGASQGIGEAIALRFANEGADLALCANEEHVYDVAENARKLGARVLALVADVSDKAQVVSLFKRIQDEFNTLDVSVHNAGIMKIARLAELSEQDWDEVMDVNCKGIFLCCQCAAQLMIPQHSGRIINAASGQARQARAFSPHYAASKAGVVGITQSLALELAPFGINVNAYCPGVINTEMWKYNDREWGRLHGYGPGDYFKEAVNRIPLGRPGSPQEVAGLVSFLASSDASYITGQAIHINGGSIMAS
jgi:meso-butanediol dehydrogenase / (S,S)-butanediol dehydrogenase / diacetyl reductase